MRINWPNVLTWLRIAMIPLIVLIYYLPWEWSHPVAALIFAAAGLTDWLDGYLARRLGLVSAFGEFLDPVADKLMVAVSLILLVSDDTRVVVALPAMIIIGREVTVSALREWMAGLGMRHRVGVSALGKIKTIAQMVGIGMMLYKQLLFGIDVYNIGHALLIIAAGLTLYSMVVYMKAAWPALNRGPEDS